MACYTGPAKEQSDMIQITDVDRESFIEMLRYILPSSTMLSVMYHVCQAHKCKCHEFSRRIWPLSINLYGQVTSFFLSFFLYLLNFRIRYGIPLRTMLNGNMFRLGKVSLFRGRIFSPGSHDEPRPNMQRSHLGMPSCCRWHPSPGDNLRLHSATTKNARFPHRLTD